MINNTHFINTIANKIECKRNKKTKIDRDAIPISQPIKDNPYSKYKSYFYHTCGNRIPRDHAREIPLVKCSRCGEVILLKAPRCDRCLRAFADQVSLDQHRLFCDADPARVDLSRTRSQGKIFTLVWHARDLDPEQDPILDPEQDPGAPCIADPEPDPDDSLDIIEPGSLDL